MASHKANSAQMKAKLPSKDLQEWTVHESQGRKYYHNIRTKVTTWDMPACFKGKQSKAPLNRTSTLNRTSSQDNSVW
eukprot:CAMPEP_0167743636 /NCGR_PEP_ID=MMETSP0110_2-20121227/2126_1 /TAXON_ID=629695 /ORGANISM="Gymnochlora sp., Strain CCMP2014" /LENGTH=76 /DNA_ID=CAMNT_0007628029 /DNA_START=364 /DNA_END=591 /DNA_ORIENTATION=+